MQTEYFIDYKLHNGTNDGWAFKTTKHTSDLTVATKEFHHQCDVYIGLAPYDFVAIVLSDMYGNPIKTEIWEQTVKPEQAPEVTDAEE